LRNPLFGEWSLRIFDILSRIKRSGLAFKVLIIIKGYMILLGRFFNKSYSVYPVSKLLSHCILDTYQYLNRPIINLFHRDNVKCAVKNILVLYIIYVVTDGFVETIAKLDNGLNYLATALIYVLRDILSILCLHTLNNMFKDNSHSYTNKKDEERN